MIWKRLFHKAENVRGHWDRFKKTSKSEHIIQTDLSHEYYIARGMVEAQKIARYEQPAKRARDLLSEI